MPFSQWSHQRSCKVSRPSEAAVDAWPKSMSPTGLASQGLPCDQGPTTSRWPPCSCTPAKLRSVPSTKMSYQPPMWRAGSVRRP